MDVKTLRSTSSRLNIVKIGVAALVVSLMVGLSYRQWSQFSLANTEAARIGQTVSLINSLLARLIDAETGQRGFLLTGKAQYLEPYNQAVQAIPGELANVKRLLAPLPHEGQNVSRLNDLIDRKLGELRRTIELRRTQGADPALDLVLSDEGRRVMDEIRVICAEIQRREISDRNQASLDGEAAAQTALLVTISGALLLLFLLALGLEPYTNSDTPAKAKERPWALSYGAAVVATIAAILLRMALTPLLDSRTAIPFITFFPAVLFAAWYGGLRPGALTVLLSTVAADYFFMAPEPSFRIGNPAELVSLLIFVVVGFGIALLGQAQRKAVARCKDAEDAERAQRQRFETTLGSIGDGVISTDAAGRIRFLNAIARSILRMEDADILGEPIDKVFRIVNEDSRAVVENPVTKVFREGAIVGLANHTILIAGDGTEIPIDDSGAPIRSESGTIQGAVLVFRDITERRRSENALRESEERFRNLANSAPVLIWVSGIDKKCTWFNRPWLEFTGRTMEQELGDGWTEGVHPDDLARCMERLEPCRIEYRLRRHDGKWRWVLQQGSPLTDANRAFLGYIGSCIDITEQKEAQTSISQMNVDLRRLNENLARSNEDLERFAFVASHDLQEPLRMITTYAQLLVKSYPNQFDREASMFVDNIVGGTTRMRELLADLLAYTEIASSLEAPVESIDANIIFEHVKQNLKVSIDETGAIVTADRLPMLRAHAAHVVPLFQNLIGNAIKYRSEQRPTVHVSVEKLNGQLQFAVADNGIGIDAQYHEQIFDVFKRLHGKKIPGSGVGLAICQRVVERYGGRIWVQSQRGQGATFFFILPDIAGDSAGEA